METKRKMATRRDIDFGYMEQFPALTYHYGLAFSELVSMPRVILELYIKRLPVLMAEEQMASIEASTFPHAKANAQKKVMRDLERTISRGRPDTKAAPGVSKSPVVMQQQLAAVGIGVTFVDANGERGEGVNDA